MGGLLLSASEMLGVVRAIVRLQPGLIVSWVPDYTLAAECGYERAYLNDRLYRWAINNPNVIERRKVEGLCCWRAMSLSKAKRFLGIEEDGNG